MAAKAELKAKLSLSKALWDRTLKSALVDAKAFGKAAGGAIVTGAKAGFAAISVAAIGAGVAIAWSTKKAYDLGSELQDMSDKTGIAADQIMILQQAAKDNGIEDITGAIGKMQKNLVEAAKNGIGPAAQALQLLGLKADDLLQSDPVKQFEAIGKAIEEIKNPALKSAEAMALFGKQGRELLPLFADARAIETASKSIGRQAQLFRQHSQEFDKVSDRLGRVYLKLQGFGVGVASSILPAMDKLTAKWDAMDFAEQGEKFGKVINPLLDRLANVDFGKVADGFVDKMQTALSYADKIGQIFSKIDQFSRRGLVLGTMDLFSKKAKVAEEIPEQPQAVQKQYNLGAPKTFFRNPDPRASMFSHELQGPNPDGTSIGGYYKKQLSPFGRGIDKEAMRKREYDSLVKRFGVAAVDKMSMSQINSRPVDHSSSLSSGGLRGGGLSSGGLGGGAYNQTGLLSRREIMAHQNELVAAGAMSRDARSNSGGRDVVRRGDAARARNFAKEQAQKNNTLEKTNELLLSIDQKLDTNTSPNP